jgi:hypothetical protein
MKVEIQNPHEELMRRKSQIVGNHTGRLTTLKTSTEINTILSKVVEDSHKWGRVT